MTFAKELMGICLDQKRREERLRELLDFLETEAPDPNRNRQLLAERASNGISAFAQAITDELPNCEYLSGLIPPKFPQI
ncbi:MAG: hypothetical protein RJA70_4716 [Pseudomonadota bacterium]